MSNIFQSVFDIVKDDMEQEKVETRGETKYECSFLADLKARQDRGNDKVSDGASLENDLVVILRQRYKKRGILISYDVKGGFPLKRLVRKSVEELKELGFEDDIWFDKDEGRPLSSSSFAQRLEVAEECNAAIVFLSHGYFLNGPSKYEANVFIQRAGSHQINPNGISFRVFVVKYTMATDLEFEMFPVDVDLTTAKVFRASVHEKASVVVGRLSEQLESCVTFTTKLYRELPMGEGLSELDGGYRGKAVYTWNTGDVQEWLCSLGVHERHRVSFEESEVDGFLLESLEEVDMAEFLGVQSKVMRQKIMQQLRHVLEKDRRTCWDECCQSRKARDTRGYLVCDPSDAWIAEFIKADLMKIGIMFHAQDDFGSSKTTPSLQSKSNARYLSEAATVIFVMSSSTEKSHFVFKELLLAAWLDKSILTAVFQNSWTNARYSVKAILRQNPAINFTRNNYLEGLEVLRYHVTPTQCQTRAIFQRQYVQKMRDGVKPLENLVSNNTDVKVKVERPKVFLSYHWDMQNKVERIKDYLNRHGCQIFTDTSRAMVVSLTKPWQYRMFDSQTRTTGSHRAFLQEGISYCTVVVLCITLKYLHSDNFAKDTQLAHLHRKPVIPIMLQWCSRPLDRVASVSRKLEMSSRMIDMSNEILFQRNLSELANLIVKTTRKSS